MKSVRMLTLAMAVIGLAASVRAGDEAAPGLLPLPELITTWSNPAPAPAAAGPAVERPAMPAAQPVAYMQPGPSVIASPAPQAPSVPPETSPSVNGPQDVFDSLGCAGNAGCGGECCDCQPSWYGYVGGIIMTRNEPNKFWTTYDQAGGNADQVLNTEQANAHWDGGEEITIGYRLCCDAAIEGTYWGIAAMPGSCSITSAGNTLGTPMDVTNGAGGLLLGGQTPDSFFTNAHEALIWRNDQVNNVEVNWAYNPWAADNCSCLQSTFLAGFRIFNFNENLLWTSVAGGFTYGSDGGANQANLDVHAENLLAGFQIGNRVDWRICNRLTMFGTPKVGIYGNHAEVESTYYRGDGVKGFDINGAKDTVSFLGEFDLGLNYAINNRWGAVLGYRVCVATGLALSDTQIPFFLADSAGFADVKINNELVLHGAFAGVSCNW